MTRLVDQALLEPVEPHDINLRQRFGARRSDVEARLSRRRKPHLGQAKNGLFPTDVEGDAQASGCVLGGLEVYFESGFQVRVTPGAMLCPHPGGAGVVTRPGTWSGRFDADDDALGLYELAQLAAAAPSPLPASVASPEWWAVVVTPQLAAVEVDSDRKVFNESTGAFDAASQNKVFHRRLVPSVVRGSGGGDISTVSLPAGAVVVAWIYVHLAGATGLDNALFYDARRMPDPSAPNRVGGRWAAHGQSLRGEVSATLKGEAMSFRSAYATSDGDVTFAAVAEPGATWPGLGAAYLYLCRVRGTVPRLRGTGSDTDELPGYTSFEVAGALVLSPTPPAVTPPEPGREAFDLRNAATLTLPNPSVPAGGAYPKVSAMKFGGTAPAGEAICVAVLLYSGLDGGIPDLHSFGSDTALACDDRGWVSGSAVAAGAPFSVPAATMTTPGSGSASAEVVVTFSEASPGKKIPVEGARFSLLFGSSNANYQAAEARQVFADLRNLSAPSDERRRAYADGGGVNRILLPAEVTTLPTAPNASVKWLLGATGTPASAPLLEATAYKLPYGRPLYTPE